MARVIHTLPARQFLSEDAIAVEMGKAAHPISDEHDLDALIEKIGNAKVVMLGEASHGTKEYYAWRTMITKRLIEEKGFSFMAVEGDWPDCFEVNRYIKGSLVYANAEKALENFKRWPSWLWANEEVRELVEWLRSHNATQPKEKQFGFYGLDVYSLWESMDTIVEYLRKHDPHALEKAYQAYLCFEPFRGDAHTYGESAAFVEKACEEEVVNLLREVRTNAMQKSDAYEERFSAEQNARVVQNAEKYYRMMVRADTASWNIRDRHMMETLERLIEYHGKNAKAIVWAHNTHIGDARATSMRDEGKFNIGELAKKTFRQKSFLVGFGSYQGSVIAGLSWGSPMHIMPVPEARRGSWEKILHDAIAKDTMLFSDEIRGIESVKRGHRAIGVVYDPDYDIGNYVPTYLTKRYDAFVYIDQTSALEPLPIGNIDEEEAPETFPSGA
jgi:erythromycin esterase